MMVPDVTSADPTASSLAPVPSLTVDHGAAKATTGSENTPAPAKVPLVSQPEETANPAAHPAQNGPGPRPAQANDDPGPGLGQSGNNPEQEIGVEGDPGQDAASNYPSDPQQPSKASKQGSGADGGTGQNTVPGNMNGVAANGGDPGQGQGQEDPHEPVLNDGQERAAGFHNNPPPGGKPDSADSTNPGTTSEPNNGFPRGPGSPKKLQNPNNDDSSPSMATMLVAGSTLTPGGNPVYLSGTLVSLDVSSHLQIGSSTINLGNNVASPAQSVFTVADHTFTAEPISFAIAGTSLTPGGSAITISGTPISLAPGGTLGIGSKTIALPPQSVFQVAGQTVTADPSGFAVGGHTVVAGSPGVYVDGSKVSPDGVPVNIHGGAMIDYGNSIAFGNEILHFPSPTPSPTTIDGFTITDLPNGVLIDKAIITPGAAPLTLSGQPISLDTSGFIHIGSASYHLTNSTLNPITLADGAIATPLPDGVSVQGIILHAGAPPVTIAGTVVSFDTSSNLIVGYTAQPLPTVSPYPLHANQLTMTYGDFIQSFPNAISGASASQTSGSSMGLDGPIVGGFESTPSLSPSASSVNGSGNSSPNSGVQIFEGQAKGLRSIMPGTIPFLLLAVMVIFWFV